MTSTDPNPDEPVADPPEDPVGAEHSEIHAVDVYWRPGCVFCMSLRRSLRKMEIPVNLHDIWEDPEAAELVRSVANGNETVPTVVIGDQFIVNPSPKAVRSLVTELAPDLLPVHTDSGTAGPGRLKRFFGFSG